MIALVLASVAKMMVKSAVATSDGGSGEQSDEEGCGVGDEMLPRTKDIRVSICLGYAGGSYGLFLPC